MKCEFEVHWFFNDKPNELKKDITTLDLYPHYTKESLTEELEQVIETERRFNKKTTISHYEIKFMEPEQDG